MDYEVARANMIEQQIRPWNVLAMQTLNALGNIRREEFVPKEFQDLAFADVKIPLPCDEQMLEPKLSARMMESLELNGHDKVLEIGTGSGYLTALMASVCGSVQSVEIHEELNNLAARNLGMAGLQNISLEIGDGHDGWGENNAYDAILVSGSLPKVSENMLAKLKDGGRLVAIEGHEPAMEVVRYTKTGQGVERVSLFETVVQRLRNVSEPAEFEF